MADDVADVLDRLDLTGVDVLGFSDGGNIALELALRHPERLRSLVVCGANLSPAGLTWLGALEVRAGYRLLDVTSRLVPALDTAAQRWRLMAQEPQIDAADLAAIQQPVLVVAGERDVVRPEHTAAMAAALPHAELSIIPRAGHLVLRNHPGALAARVKEFFQAVDGARPTAG